MDTSVDNVSLIISKLYCLHTGTKLAIAAGIIPHLWLLNADDYLQCNITSPQMISIRQHRFLSVMLRLYLPDDIVVASFHFQMSNSSINPQTKVIDNYSLEVNETERYVLPTSSLPNVFVHGSMDWRFPAIKVFNINYSSRKEHFSVYRLFYKLKFSFFKYHGFKKNVPQHHVYIVGSDDDHVPYLSRGGFLVVCMWET